MPRRSRPPVRARNIGGITPADVPQGSPLRLFVPARNATTSAMTSGRPSCWSGVAFGEVYRCGPGRPGRASDGRQQHDAGDVDDDIQSAELGLDGIEGGRHRVLVGDDRDTEPTLTGQLIEDLAHTTGLTEIEGPT